MKDGSTSVDIDAGFKVAPGDASDVEVANTHAWGSRYLILSDGASAGTALGIAKDPSAKGIARSFPIEILRYNLMMISGKKGGGNLRVDAAGRVMSTWSNCDFLLRKRA